MTVSTAGHAAGHAIQRAALELCDLQVAWRDPETWSATDRTHRYHTIAPPRWRPPAPAVKSCECHGTKISLTGEAESPGVGPPAMTYILPSTVAAPSP